MWPVVLQQPPPLAPPHTGQWLIRSPLDHQLFFSLLPLGSVLIFLLLQRTLFYFARPYVTIDVSQTVLLKDFEA